MNIKLLGVVVLGLALLGIGWSVAQDSGPLERPESLAIGGEPIELDGTAVAMAKVQLASERATAAVPVVPAELEPAAVPIPDTLANVRGRVFDGGGRPLANMRVRLEPELLGIGEMVTSVRGEVSGQTALAGVLKSHLVPSADGWSVLFRAPITVGNLERAEPAMLAVAPSRVIPGVVLNGEGEAVPGARVTLVLPESLAARFDHSVARTTFGAWEVTSVTDGSFELDGAPSLAGCSITVSADGYDTTVLEDIPLELEQYPLERLEFRLLRQDPLGLVRGVVLDPQGAPVVGATVGLGLPIKVTDAAGEFEFDLNGDAGAALGLQRLIAWAPGWCPVEFAPHAATGHTATGNTMAGDPTASGSIEWPDRVVLQFSDEALSIEGVALDRDGEPRAGLWVWLDDPTVLGSVGNGRLESNEYAGLNVISFAERYQSDSDGRFRITQLASRPYTLVAMDPETLLRSVPKVIPAGTSSAVLQLDPGGEVAHVSGRIISSSGLPIEGARIHRKVITHLVNQPGQSSTRANIVHTEPVLADHDGFFALKNLPLNGGLELSVSATGFQSKELLVADIKAPYDDLVIVLFSHCKARVVGEIPIVEGGATGFRLLTATGESLRLWSSQAPGSSQQSAYMKITDGASLPFSVSVEAVTIEYLLAGKVVGSNALRLEAGEFHEIRR